jgi:O-methyltransferase involved in polyketide biosynthesis
MDNNQAEWFCVDAAYVESFWNQLIGESQRNHFISSAVTDLDWMNQIVETGRAVLFVAEGVFLYLTESEVKRVILSLQQRFPDSEIVMEVIGKFIRRSHFQSPPILPSNPVLELQLPQMAATLLRVRA